MKKTEIEAALAHFQKLIKCEKFIITGSYMFHLLGLTNSVKDVDVVLVNLDEESRKVLEKLNIDDLKNYPGKKDQFRVKLGEVRIDFFVSDNEQAIELADGKLLSYPLKAVKEKQKYGSLKQILQLKGMAEQIYTPDMLKRAVIWEQSRVNADRIDVPTELDELLSPSKNK